MKTVVVAAAVLLAALGAGWLYWDRVFCPKDEATRIVSVWLNYWGEQPAPDDEWRTSAEKVAVHLVAGDPPSNAAQASRQVRYEIVPGCLASLKQQVLSNVWARIIKETGAIPCFEYVQGVNTYSHRCRRSDSPNPAHW